MKISIITVTYNSEKYILSNIENILSQTYKNIEHIIIDGLSSDNTYNIIKNSKFNGILVSEKDNGIYDAINKGISIASGDLVGILHSDDIFFSNNTIQLIVEEFKLNRNLNFIFGNLIYKNSDLSKNIRIWKSRNGNLILGWMAPHPTIFLTKNTLKDVGFYDSTFKISADYDFIIKLFKDNKFHFKYINDFITIMRIGGVSNRKLFLKFKEDYMVLKKNKFKFPVIIIFFKNIRKLIQFI